MVTHARQVPDTAASDQDNGVLLQIVTDTRDVGRDFDAVGQTDTGYFTQCRVRFFGVVVYTRVQTPRFCGQFFRAGAVDFVVRTSLPLRISWLIVGISGTSFLSIGFSIYKTPVSRSPYQAFSIAAADAPA